MSDTDRIVTDDAPRTDNPYSQGVRDGDRLYVSGYGPVDPATGEEVEGDVQAQTERVLDNIAAVVDEAGGRGLDDVVKVTVYLTDLDDYGQVNEAYGAAFTGTHRHGFASKCLAFREMSGSRWTPSRRWTDSNRHICCI